MAELYVGLVHYPIYNKRMDVIASAVTNFDIHDIARTCRTYDVKQYYLIPVIERGFLIRSMTMLKGGPKNNTQRTSNQRRKKLKDRMKRNPLGQ